MMTMRRLATDRSVQLSDCADPASDGRGPGARPDTYKAKCAMCHGADGMAQGQASHGN